MWENRVLFLDGEALVIDKPAGLAVHAGPRTPASLEDHLHQLRFGFERSPSLVHRLDRDTSGCLLLARNPKAHKRFAQAFEEGRVTKTYVAVLDGIPDAEQGVIDLALAKVSTKAEGWRMIPDAQGKPAVTRWRIAAVRDGRSLAVFTPETGRTHQIRVHAAHGLGVPIAGDPVYGRGGRPPSTGSGEGMLLHSRALRLERNGKAAIDATAALPSSFSDAGFNDADL
jgi:tRNA pseudouridine32 synthase/23S rRNA pseudouridine746 synthase